MLPPSCSGPPTWSPRCARSSTRSTRASAASRASSGERGGGGARVTARLVVAGTHSGVGKTTVATGLMAAFAARGRAVAGFKVGPDFIDPSYHALATGRPARNLDAFLSGPELIAPLFAHGAHGADLAVVEGVMGMFDGAGGAGELASTAQVAKLLRAPVLLVVDCGAMARSVAALVHGFASFDPAVDVAGVVLNRVGSQRHDGLLRQALEPLGIPVLGVLGRPVAPGVPSPARAARAARDRLGAGLHLRLPGERRAAGGERRGAGPGRPDRRRAPAGRDRRPVPRRRLPRDLRRGARGQPADACGRAGPRRGGRSGGGRVRRPAVPGAHARRPAHVRAARGGRSHDRPAHSGLPAGERHRPVRARRYRDRGPRARVPLLAARAVRGGDRGMAARRRPSGGIRGRRRARQLPAHPLGGPLRAARAPGDRGAEGSGPMTGRTGTTGRLVGVGVGPGDPELLTVKGGRALREADVAFVPVGGTGETGRAEAVALAYVAPARVRRLTFALAGDAAAREASWDRAGAEVTEVVAAGGVAAFATLGDPSVYSTFSYLAATEGGERLALLPLAAGTRYLADALTSFDTVVCYKSGRHLPEVVEALRAAGRLERALYGARLGLAGETIRPAAELGDRPGPYLSTVIALPERPARGSKL